MKNENKKDIILIFDGGCMRGVFGAGVTSQFLEDNMYERIHSVYGISAGAHNAAFFITKDYKKGSSVYYEDLINGSFLYNNKIIFILKLIKKIFKRKTKLNTQVNVDYVVDVEKTTKKLDIKKVLSSDIKFFVKVFNIRKKEEEYLNGKINIFETLSASSALYPFYPKRVKIKHMTYFDGNILSPTIDLHMKKIITENKDKKIIFVSNTPIQGIGALKKQIEDLFLGFLVLCHFKKYFVIKKTLTKIKYNKAKEYLQFPNLYVISPNHFLSPLCEDKNVLLKLYSHGIKKAENFDFKNRLN